MSPRRRLAVTAAALVLLVVIAFPLVRGFAGGSTVVSVPQGRPGTVLLVSGYGGGTAQLDVLAAALRRAGRTASVVPVVGDGTGDLTAQAAVLRRAADAEIAAGAPSVDVVGYSAGGVVARIWASRLGGAAHARRVVTLGSPFHGTQVAELAAAAAPGACPAACRQLVPGSDLLAGLAANPPATPWTSIWTARDTTVVPPASASLAGATDIQLQRICPDSRVQHGTLPTDPLVVGIVVTVLDAAQPATEAPEAAACTRLRAVGRRALSS